MPGPDRELEEILRIARAASSVVREVYATAFSVDMKGPNDPVTRADREANSLICARLAEAFPGEAVIAEESVTADAAREVALKERVFYVDPLDGTREFVDRNGEFAVMIGLAVRGRAHLGVVVIPASGEALAGRTGLDSDRGNAFLEDETGSRRSLEVPPLPPIALDASSARLVISRSHRPPLVEKLSICLGLSQITPCGSVGVKVARVATGRADLYIHDGGGAKRWDTCGPEAILRAAGGRFTDLRGDPIVYAGDDLVVRGGLVASNGLFHDVAVQALRALLS